METVGDLWRLVEIHWRSVRETGDREIGDWRCTRETRDWMLGAGDWGLETREGARYARVIYRSSNRKPEESPRNERVNEALFLRQYCGYDTCLLAGVSRTASPKSLLFMKPAPDTHSEPCWRMSQSVNEPRA